MLPLYFIVSTALAAKTVVLSAPASWWKLAVVPVALFAVHSNWSALHHAVSELYAPLNPAAADACKVTEAWAAARDDHARSIVADPFPSWDFAACSALPTM